MKRIMLMLISISSLVLLILTDTGALERVWVYAKGAPLKADKTASSETITRLTAGTALNVLSVKKRWYHVSTDSDEKGWIFRGKISKSPPEQSPDEEDDLLGELSDSNIMLAAADTSRSIRGKSRKSKTPELENKTEEKYLQALDTVLSFYTSDDEIEQFLEQGRIGEYAGD